MKTDNRQETVRKYLAKKQAQSLFPSQIRDKLTIFFFEPEETIIDQNKDMQDLLLLVDGRAKLLSDQSNGRTLLVDFLEYPAIIGEWEMRGNAPICAIRAITPCVCIGLAYETIRESLYDNAAFWRTMNEINGIKTQRQIDHCIKTITFPLEVRCAYYIYYNSYNSFYREPHTEASAYLGVSYRHLLHTIDNFIKRGIMEKTEAGYKIVDPQRLFDCMQ